MTIPKEILDALTLLAAIGSGVVAGVFFAFSTFVMKALTRIPIAAGVAAMQAINVTVFGPWFMGAFFGTGAASLALLVHTASNRGGDGALHILAGGVLYLAGTLLVTVVFNVPRNDRLAALSPSAPDAEREWRSYVSGWTAWNHVRTAASIAAATAFTLGLVGAGVW